jgi:hypothetical protein
MKTSALGLILLLGSLGPVSAQLRVEVTQEQDQFLQGESLPVAVRITNRSGQTLHLGGEEDWLSFSIESSEGPVVPMLGDVPVKGEFELGSSLVATKRADLAPYFGAMAPGRYAVTATVHIKGWNQDVSSPPKHFDVIEGARLWEQEVGVPQSAGVSNTVPELRKYVLQQANYLRRQLKLYLRITDSYGKTYRVFPVGSMVSFSRPEPQVDRFSHLHVIYQDGPTHFRYSAFDLEGNLLARQTYDYVGTRPRLRLDDDGIVSVFGGVRRITTSDVPPSAFDDNLAPVRTNETAKAKP